MTADGVDDGTWGLIAQAQQAIGAGGPEDWKVEPSRHARELDEHASGLAAVLRRSAPETVAREFERLDVDAVALQAKFKRTSNRANLAVLITASLSAAMLAVASIDAIGDARRAVLGALGFFSVVSGALDSMWLYRLKQARLLDRWNTARAAAETQRLNYFQTVTGATSTAEGGIPLPLLQLEYFRRYQLDAQIAF